MTGIIEGPKNRGKEKKSKIRRGGRDNIETNSLSPILTISPYLRLIHQEQTESSERHGNNTELMEMLNAMRQEMKEMDKQLKIQLQLRDEYMDAELRRRDQNLEEALRQRDEEWKSKLETKEKELSEELRVREDAFFSD